MKKQLLFIALSVSLFSSAQISVGLINDFEDGTTQGWSNGGSSPNPPSNVTNGGPNGANDNYLEEISAGGGGAGSKLIIFNASPDWTGDFLSLGIEEISFDAQSPSDQDLLIRVAFEGGSDDTQIATTNAITVPGLSTWTNYTVSIAVSDFTIVNSGTNTVTEVLQDVQEARILHNPNPDFNGASIAAVLHLDNITTAVPVLGVNDFIDNSTSIFPTLATDMINIQSDFIISEYEIFDVQGRNIMNGLVSNSRIEIGNLHSGNYVVKLTSDEGLVTAKKFIKQ